MTKRIITAVVAAVTMANASSVVAQSASGTLSVTAQVSATCETPEPSGTLRLPFDASEFLSSQPLSEPVSVSITCSGGATIEKVAFDDGQNADEGALTGRVLRQTDGDACFNYGLQTDTTENGSFSELGLESDGDGGNEVVSFGKNNTFYVTGGIYGAAINDGSGACGDNVADGDAATMPGGTYRDQVTMTVTFQ